MNTLDHYVDFETQDIQPSFSVGEVVRNTTFHDILEELPDRQMEIFEIILEHGPISSIGIQEITGKPLHTFSGRLSELANPKGKKKLPYHNPPLIRVCGVEMHRDYRGRMRNYTKYQVVR